ncbi:hypothetical protein FACS1894145_0630 [Bacteroidia bacterium]|nr:hypothetical protein FACS1894145_0630 [Bacteroidia bacterium]
MLQEILKYVLPQEIVDYFELIDIKQEGDVLHLHLDEKPVPPPEYAHVGLSGNGFYERSTIKDFPLRDKKVLLHVRRRRWIDEYGKSYFRDWDLVARGTRYSKELASFLKEKLGYTPDTGSDA